VQLNGYTEAEDRPEIRRVLSASDCYEGAPNKHDEDDDFTERDCDGGGGGGGRRSVRRLLQWFVGVGVMIVGRQRNHLSCRKWWERLKERARARRVMLPRAFQRSTDVRLPSGSPPKCRMPPIEVLNFSL
jgi:hypothetical protein